jgi:ORF6N domain
MTAADHTTALQAERSILLIRSQKVMLDFDLAELYGVPTKALNQAVRRNLERFPEDFMFQLTADEVKNVVSQSVIASSVEGEDLSQSVMSSRSRSQSVTLKRGQNIKYLPYAFTEQGVAMLSSVLRSDRAVQVNIAIMRAFVRLRQMLSTNADLARKLEDMEKKYDGQFKIVFDALRQLMAPPLPKSKKEIGFHTLTDTKKKPKARAKR